MCHCWLARGSSRPTFADLHVVFDQYMGRHLSEEYPYIDMDASDPYQFDHLAPKTSLAHEEKNGGIFNIDDEENSQALAHYSSGYEISCSRDVSASNQLTPNDFDASGGAVNVSETASPYTQGARNLEDLNAAINGSPKKSHQSLRRLHYQEQLSSDLELGSPSRSDSPYSKLRVTDDLPQLSITHASDDRQMNSPLTPHESEHMVRTKLEKNSPSASFLELQAQRQLPVSQNSILLENMHDQFLCKKLSTITENSYEDGFEQHECGTATAESNV